MDAFPFVAAHFTSPTPHCCVCELRARWRVELMRARLVRLLPLATIPLSLSFTRLSIQFEEGIGVVDGTCESK